MKDQSLNSVCYQGKKPLLEPNHDPRKVGARARSFASQRTVSECFGDEGDD